MFVFVVWVCIIGIVGGALLCVLSDVSIEQGRGAGWSVVQG